MSQILDLNTTQEVTQGHPLECHLGLWHQFLFKLYSFQKVYEILNEQPWKWWVRSNINLKMDGHFAHSHSLVGTSYQAIHLNS